MKIAILSDIHGNLQALEAVLADIDAQQVDTVFCLGDLVGYGASPNEVIGRIRAKGFPTIMGNYDDGVGFDAHEVERPGRQGGLGLLGIRERVSQLGGTVRIDSTIGSGTRLAVSIPAAAHRAAAPAVDDPPALQLSEVHHG